jgi:hypothetical protein
MPLFVKRYGIGRSSLFRGWVAELTGGDAIAVGDSDGAGLLTRLGPRGEPLWARSYRSAEGALQLSHGVATPDGDALVYGGLKRGQRQWHLVIRVAPGGAVVWARAYAHAKTRFTRRLVRSRQHGYYFTGWHNQRSSVDSVELARIDGSGELMGARLFGDDRDNQVTTLVPYGDGFVALGETQAVGGWRGFVAAFEPDLSLTWARLLGDSSFDTVQTAVPLARGNLLVAGLTSPQGARNLSASYLASFSPVLESARGNVFDFYSGGDQGTHELLAHGQGYYLLSRSPAREDTLVGRLNLGVTFDWVRGLDLGTSHALMDLQVAHPEDELLACGFERGDERAALMVRTDLELLSCKTVEADVEAGTRGQRFSVREWQAEAVPLEMEVLDLTLREEPVDSRATAICRPTTRVPLGTDSRVQSPYLYLQAVGSDASDGSCRGAHLRWELRGTPGEHHLPKGRLAAPDGEFPTSIGFNRNDDYVRLYRAELTAPAPIRVDLQRPATNIADDGPARVWGWSAGGEGEVDDVFTPAVAVRFTDVAAYDALRAELDPRTQPGDFLSAYPGVLEVATPGRSVFQIDLSGFSAGAAEAWLRLETISVTDPLEPDGRRVSCRRQLGPAELPDATLLAEDVVVLHLQARQVRYGVLALHSYADTIAAHNAGHGAWTELGAFSLTLDDQEVFARLENPEGDPEVDGGWPRYHGADPASGAFTVRAANYRDKWLPADRPEEGVREAVRQYLERSRSDEKAPASLPSDQEGDEAHLDISYLDMLRLIAVDFHVARMLGLGHLDNQGPELAHRRFLYLAEYVTEAPLEPGGASERVHHLAMSLPTAQPDHRLPAPPALLPPSYGLTVDNATPNPTVLTLEGGYDRFADARYVNLHKEPAEEGRAVGQPFSDPEPFCLSEETPPVLFGVEYRAASEEPYRRPGIASDPEYLDGAGLPEVAPLPETGDPERPVFVHRETESGVHLYALYAINWFSRVSALSGEVATDSTDFPERAAPDPPLNFAAHLIQREEPRIFTTPREQAMLSALSGDQTLVRVTFDWNQVQHRAYQFADRIELFFRQRAPLMVRGAVRRVARLADGRVRVETEAFPIASGSPPRTVQPMVLPQEAARFAGGTLTAGERSYTVEEVLQTSPSGHEPVFVVAPVRETTSIDLDGRNELLTLEDFAAPRAGEHLLAVESLDEESRWDGRLAKTIAVSPLDASYGETVVTSDGRSIQRVIGGVFEKAEISEIPDVDEEGDVVAESSTGAYEVVFDTYQLPASADPDVEWYLGTARILEDAASLPSPREPGRTQPLVKVLQVLEIDRSGDRLRLVVYDPTYRSGPDNLPHPEYVPIATGSGVNVNFHPSYRVYLRADTASGFTAAALLPAAGEGSRQTLLGARAVDTDAGRVSAITAPAILMAQELVEPEPPGEPTGPLYATRPDIYGKATYTFDVKVNVDGRAPYSLVFYRADERRILETLYKPATIYHPETGILARLAALESPDADFDHQRWHDLANQVFDPETKRYRTYLDGGFRFPVPDNDEYQIPNPVPGIDDRPFDGVRTFGDTFAVTRAIEPEHVTEPRSFDEIVTDAVDGAFLPLTEQPVIFKYVEAREATSGRKPVVRDDSGRLLPPDHADFDPFPMAVLRDGGSAVRFTDFTLDGASRRLFFYFAVELSNRLRPGERSGISGPVRLVNTAPPEAPGIRKVTTRLADRSRGLGAAVCFEVNEYIASEDVTNIEIYRSLESAAALSLRSMTRVRTLDVDEEIVDEFSDLPFPPFGDPLFYRLVAVREIVNESEKRELVRSRATPTALASIVDNLNPPAPEVTWDSDLPPSDPPVELTRVVLSWPRTCHNGTYYLYRMNRAGNWSLIYQVRSNESSLQYPPAADGGPDFAGFGETARLVKEEDGRPLFHRFKVDVENASGLLNLEDKPVVI